MPFCFFPLIHRYDSSYASDFSSLQKLKMEILMDVQVDREAFLRGLQMAHNIVEPRQTMPILANVLVEAEGEQVRLTATDLEVGVRVSLPAQVARAGSVTISARKLLDIVKELPVAPLSLRVQENAWVA